MLIVAVFIAFICSVSHQESEQPAWFVILSSKSAGQRDISGFFDATSDGSVSARTVRPLALREDALYFLGLNADPH